MRLFNIFLFLIFSYTYNIRYLINIFFFIIFYKIFINNNSGIDLSYLYIPIADKILFYLNNSKYSIFLFIVIYTYTSITISKKNLYNKLMLVLILYFLFQYQIYFNIYSIFINSKNYNTTLLNGFLIIHPIFLYIGINYILGFINSIRFEKIFFKNCIYLFKYKYSLYIYMLLALVLGCWWAQQELNWGGWWNWDPIELIALLFFINSIYIIHTKMYTPYYIVFYKKIIYFILLFSYFISRYDLLNSIHSFVSSSTDLELKVIILLFLIFIIVFKINDVFIFKKFLNNSFYFLCFIYLYIIMYVLNIFIVETNFNINVYIYIIYTIFFKKYFFKKNNQFILHLLLFVILFGILLFSKTDIYTYLTKTYTYYYVKTLTINQGMLYSMHDYTNIGLINVFSKINMYIINKHETILHFFFQNISNNTILNVNTIIMKNIIKIFQLSLVTFIILLIIVIFLFLKKIKKNGIV